jgi:hypothetical protein
MQSSAQGYLFGGLVSQKTGRVYTSDVAGLVAKIPNPVGQQQKNHSHSRQQSRPEPKPAVLALTNFWKKTLETLSEQRRICRGSSRV